VTDTRGAVATAFALAAVVLVTAVALVTAVVLVVGAAAVAAVAVSTGAVALAAPAGRDERTPSATASTEAAPATAPAATTPKTRALDGGGAGIGDATPTESCELVLGGPAPPGSVPG
jgi:hypothetical protein